MNDDDENYLTRRKNITIDEMTKTLEQDKYIARKKMLINAGLVSIVGAGLSMLLVIWGNPYGASELLLKIFFTFITIGVTSAFGIAFLSKSNKV